MYHLLKIFRNLRIKKYLVRVNYSNDFFLLYMFIYCHDATEKSALMLVNYNIQMSIKFEKISQFFFLFFFNLIFSKKINLLLIISIMQHFQCKINNISIKSGNEMFFTRQFFFLVGYLKFTVVQIII